MKRLDIPFLCLGPAGVGKTKAFRQILEEEHKTTLTYPLEQRTFTIGDGYEARVLASPFHFEIDIPNLSMQDKQIIGDLLTSFFSSGDVLNSLRSSSRKLVILRRAHSLSLAAAIRVRSILHQFVLPPEAPGMLWMTAREMTGPLSILDDAFVRYHIPRMTFMDWKKVINPPFDTQLAWEKCEGRKERVDELIKFLPAKPPTQPPTQPNANEVFWATNPEKWPRRIQDFYDEMIQFLIQHARSGSTPNLLVVQWIRMIVYQCLSFCQTGPDIIDSCAAALERCCIKTPTHEPLLEPQVFWLAMTSLTSAEPHTSYRTPLSLESALLFLYETIRTHSTKLTEGTSATAKIDPPQIENELRSELRSELPSKLCADAPSNTETGGSNTATSETPKTIKPRVRRSKKPDQ